MKSMYFDIPTRAIIDVDPEFVTGRRRIARMNVPTRSRNQGVGSRLMAEVCADADAEGLILHLEPLPYDGPERLQDLLRFYARFGFVEDSEIGCIRYPQAEESAA